MKTDNMRVTIVIHQFYVLKTFFANFGKLGSHLEVSLHGDNQIMISKSSQSFIKADYLKNARDANLFINNLVISI